MTIKVEIDPERPDRIALHSEWRHKEQAKSVPGATWDRDRNMWTVPLSWTSCLALRSTFQHELEISPDLAEWAFALRAAHIDPALAVRTALDAPGDPDLFSYQRADVQFLAAAERAILGSEPGTGKTGASIRAMVELTRRGHNVFPALVVCPNSMKLTWKREIERWWPGCTATVVHGSAVQRRKQLAEKAHFRIINYEALRTHSRLAPYGSIALRRCKACGGEDDKVTTTRCEVHVRELNLIDFRTVIADETHRAKDPKAKQTRALKSATGNAPYRFGLTGTPIANDPSDLWSLLNWLDPQEWPSRTRWIDRMLNVMFNAWGGLIISGIKPEMETEFFAGIDPHFRRMTKEVVLPFLPPIVEERRDVEMHPKQKKAYTTMGDQLIAQLDDDELLVATSPLTQTIRLLQFASSYGVVEAIPNPDSPTGYREHLLLSDPSNKIDAFLEDLPDFGSQSIVLFAVSRQLIELLSARLVKAKVPHGLITGAQSEHERQAAIDDFQAGRTKLILCTIQAGGVGITLTAASVMVFLQRSWSLVDMDQAVARCHRIGSEKHESILRVDYVTSGTIEEAVIGALSGKGVQFEELVRDAALLRAAITGQSAA